MFLVVSMISLGLSYGLLSWAQSHQDSKFSHISELSSIIFVAISIIAAAGPCLQ